MLKSENGLWGVVADEEIYALSLLDQEIDDKALADAALPIIKKYFEQ